MNPDNINSFSFDLEFYQTDVYSLSFSSTWWTKSYHRPLETRWITPMVVWVATPIMINLWTHIRKERQSINFISIGFWYLCMSYHRNVDRITFWKWKGSESDLESSFERFIQTPGHLSLRPHVLQLRIWCCQFLHLWFWINIIVFHTIFIISCHSRFEHLTINYSSIDDSSIIFIQRAENRVLTLRIPSSRFENERKLSNHHLRI